MERQWSLRSVIEVALFLIFMTCGYFFGRLAEKRHFKSIIERERKSNKLPAIASRYPPEDTSYHQQLVAGSVVVASDYFKSFTAGLINIFGGSVTPFESLLDRGRREAILRMKDEAEQLNASMVFNIKLETTRIATGRAGAIEVLAYGTAMIPLSSQTSEHAGYEQADFPMSENVVADKAI